MSKSKKPSPIFEVVFDGPNLYPERIPLGTLTQTLSAIRRLAAGAELLDGDEAEDEPDEQNTQLGLLEVVRGSAVFRFVGESPDLALNYLREAGNILRHPEKVGDNDYVLRPIERLSLTARRLGCSIIVKEPGKGQPILARIEPASYESISKNLFISGETSFTGQVKRVGGATEMRCALRVPFQDRLLFCEVASGDVARKLGDHLYQEVAVSGTANWIRHTWKIATFTIRDAQHLPQAKLTEAMAALRKAGGHGWDAIADPNSYLQEVRGK